MRLSVIYCFLLLLLTSCGGSDFEKNPVDVMIRDMTDVPQYTIMLYDMREEGTFFKDYEHQYRVIKQDSEDAKPEEEVTRWYDVSKDFFNQHVNDMGMEVASKSADGEVSKNVSPPGYSNYVGNSQYGRWQTGANGNSFWAFYGQYAFLSSMLNMASFPIRRSYYNDYRSNYRSGRPYYGPVVSNGSRAYGTGSAYTSAAKPNSNWRTSSRSRSSSQGFRSGSRTSRSGSRYGGSSMRSRGGGFGK